MPYDLNTPLFSDYAHKLRTLYLPTGNAARYDARETFDLPVGTILSKTFYYPRGGDTATRRWRAPMTSRATLPARASILPRCASSRTRVLVRRAQGWEALPYVWNAEQTDAQLERTGDEVALELIAGDGSREAFTYVVPNENQCAGCHVTDLNAKAIAPIGLKARHLNRDFTYAAGTENQLAHLEKLGFLGGVPALAEVPRNANWRDTQAPLEARGRAHTST